MCEPITVPVTVEVSPEIAECARDRAARAGEHQTMEDFLLEVYDIQIEWRVD